METWRDEDKKVVRVRKLHYTYFMVMTKNIKISMEIWKDERKKVKNKQKE